MKEFTVNKSVTTFSKQYLLEGLNSGTTYNVEVRVLVDEAGLGDPVTIKVTTRSSGKYGQECYFFYFFKTYNYIQQLYCRKNWS